MSLDILLSNCVPDSASAVPLIILMGGGGMKTSFQGHHPPEF